MGLADILSDREEYRYLSEDSLQLVRKLREAGVPDVIQSNEWEKVSRKRGGPDSFTYYRYDYLSPREIEEIFNPQDPFERASLFMEQLERNKPTAVVDKEIREGRLRQAPYIKNEGLLKFGPTPQRRGLPEGILKSDLEELSQDPEERKKKTKKAKSDIRKRFNLKGAPLQQSYTSMVGGPYRRRSLAERMRDILE